MSTPLGNSNVQVGRLGLGLASIGGLFRPASDAIASDTIVRALELGVRLFDTAPLYGYGLSERRAGTVFRRFSRNELLISTKVGLVLEVEGPDTQAGWSECLDEQLTPRFDYSYAGTRKSFEGSLERLGVDHLDIVHIHDANEEHFGMAMRGSYAALIDLKAAGHIGAIGVGLTQASLLARFAREIGPPGFDCFILGGRYTLLDQSGFRELLPLCAAKKISVIAGGVFNSGILANPNPSAHFEYEAVSTDVLHKVLALEAICTRFNVPLRAAALQFPLAHPAVVSILVGARTASQVEDVVAMLDYPVPLELWRELKAVRLLPSEVPTPN